MGIVFVPIWVERLGVESYALIGFYAILQGWLALLDFGMTPTMNREMARSSAGAHTPDSIGDLMRSIELVCFSVAAAMAVLIWLSSGWLAHVWFSPQTLSPTSIADAITVMAFVIGSRFCEGIYRGALFGMERQLWYNCVNALLSTIRYAGAAVIVVWISPSIQAFFWWQALISVLTVCILCFATHRWMPTTQRRPRFSLPALRSVATFAGGLSLTTLIGLLLTHMDKVMLSRLLSLDTFGYYMLAVTISGLFPMFVWPIATAFYPSLTVAAATNNEAEAARGYSMATQLAALLLAPAVAVCVFFPEDIILAWTGDVALSTEVGPLLRLLSIGMAANSFLQIPFGLQLAHGWTSLGVKVNIIAVFVLIPGEYLAARQFGGIGAAGVWGGINVAILPIVAWIMHQRLLPGEVRRWFWYGIAMPIVLSFAVVGVVSVILDLPQSRLAAIASILTVGFAAFLTVGIALPETRRLLFQSCSTISQSLFLRARCLASIFTEGPPKR